MSEELRAFPIVITGHVDHGKSTLIGRLLYDYGALQEERYDEVRQSSSDIGREDEFAFVLDAFEEERQRGITIDTSQIFFKTSFRPYVIIDVPGHREFLRNMVTGASYAEAAVLIVDACEGIREQTRRHAWLLTVVGLRDICVVINKLDAVGYDQERYRELCSDIKNMFEEFSLSPYAIVPVSALTGDNLVCRSAAMPWYSGPSLVEVLDGFESKPFEIRPFRFPVQDIYTINGERIIVGRVESGSVHPGMHVTVLPQNVSATIAAIKKYPFPAVQSSSYGEAIGLVLDGKIQVSRGDIIASGLSPQVSQKFSAHLFWFHESYTCNDRVILRCTTQAVPARIELEEVFDPGDENMVRNNIRIESGEVAKCSIISDHPWVADYFSLIPEMGRFVIESDGIPVGGGIVL
ncbi:MAG: 50S ribosome-binding GTPase [Desulfuromonadales bacterium]|nr:50S ribosome-binding GTPase [Desulfuromonadales bacterium]